MNVRVLRASTVLALLTTTVALTACGSEPSEGNDVAIARSALAHDVDPQVAPGALDRLVTGNTAFAADLYKQLGGGTFANQNMFFSAHSISSAFAMLYGGARGATEGDIARGMHFTLPQNEIHAAMNRLTIELAGRARAGAAEGATATASASTSTTPSGASARSPGRLRTSIGSP